MTKQSKTMHIAELTELDLPMLAELYRLFWGEDSSPDKMRSTFARLNADPNYLLLGSKQDGRLVGSVMGIVCEELYGDCRPFMVVEDVVVDADHRRQGIGSELMRALEQRAVQHGCGYIMLVTDQDRVDSHHFYESLGYGPNTHKGFKKRLDATQ